MRHRISSKMDDDNFQWGALGAEWWRETGASVNASREQIRYACLLHQGGMTQHFAAQLAGYNIDPAEESGRATASHAKRSKAVRELLALAAAEDAKTKNTVQPLVLSPQERAAILSEMGRDNKDPAVRIRAIEALERQEQQKRTIGQVPDDDGFMPWRTVRDFLIMPGGAVAIFSLLTASGEIPSSFPLLRDVYGSLRKSADPGIWDRLMKKLTRHSRIETERLLADSEWQREAREKIWREIGREPPDWSESVEGVHGSQQSGEAA